ncbi:MAG: serine hydrolase [Bacteroidia bacterium]|nr:serine hydrolase [Bacteroidia bacterium]
MKRFISLLIITIYLGNCTTNAQAKKYPANVEEKIKQVENNLAGWVQTGNNDRWNLAERMKKYGINGVSIAVVHNYKIEWARGYGFADISEKRPVTEATLFQAASISKSLNSLGVLKLVQEKRLDLEADINKYLVSWKFPYDEKSNNKKITIANLLSHTGGLTIHGFPGYSRGDSLPTLPQILDGQKPANTEAVRSSSEPGKNVNYSGGGITITQLIVMDVTHQPYDVFMKKNVLDPLGMTASSFAQPPEKGKENLFATGYKADGSEVPGKYHIYPEQAAAGLWTDPTDLCKYIIETQLSYKGESSRVLTPEMTRKRLTPVLEDAALGTFVNSRVTDSYKYFNHNGGNEGFSCTSIGCRDNGEGVVIMTNSDNSSILEEIANSVASVYNWKDYYLPEIKKVVNVDKSVLAKYTGKYDFNGTQITITMSDTGLSVNPFGNVRWQLYFTSDSDFFVRESRGMAKFRTDKDSKVKGFISDGQLMKKI